MPSSHTALIVAVTHAIGLTEGFASAPFALAFVVAMIVVYDATGVRRQAGKAAAAARAAASTPAASQSGVRAMTSPVAGLTTCRDSRAGGSTHTPST
jgi:acid phosphatase family membrane protein YuiD